MICHYLSDLHLESQAFPGPLPKGDVLIVAGDLCHARRLDPTWRDKYSADQRGRVHRFIDEALANFAHVLLIAGNHDHYDGVFEDTHAFLRRHLPGVTVLDNADVVIDGVRFFGSTLWSDFEGRSEACLDRLRKRMGEYFFVKKRWREVSGQETLAKFRPEDALSAFEESCRALHQCLGNGKRTVVITHHAPSRKGLNPKFAGNGLDGAYASNLDEAIAQMSDVPVWIHGHTHIAGSYQIAGTTVRSNALGFAAKGYASAGFSVNASFEI
jgi:Icc-related predicted phosphoesterase